MILAAALYGAGVPASKKLLGDFPPVMLAGIFYAAAGVGLLAVRAFRRREPPVRRSDVGWLLAATACGGVAAPILLFFGLERISAHSAALLSNLETFFTAAIAVLFFGDFMRRRDVAAMLLLVGGAGAVGWSVAEGGGATTLAGVGLVAAGALSWALDNNFTQKISGRDPVHIAALKSLIAGATNLAIAAAMRSRLNADPATLGAAAAVGFFAYGVSLVLFVVGLRHLGAARTSTLFATAPAFAVALAWAWLGETPHAAALAGGAAMIAGAALIVKSDHSHRHAHAPVEHEHVHVHDEHHRHAHPDGAGPEPHSHPHLHEPLEHEHSHVPDLHHRHGH